jgi:outer membrane protein
MKRFCGILAGAVLAAAAARGAELKLAVVDMERLIKAHPDTKSDLAVLEKQAEEFESENKSMREELDKLKTEFEDARDEARSSVLSEEARRDKTAVAEEKLMSLRKYEMEIRETIAVRQKQVGDQRLRMRRRIVGKIQDAVAEVAGAEKVSAVLDRSSLGVSGAEIVVYADDALDLTAKVMRAIGGVEATDEGE